MAGLAIDLLLFSCTLTVVTSGGSRLPQGNAVARLVRSCGSWRGWTTQIGAAQI
jgi:hypothetical protein